MSYKVLEQVQFDTNSISIIEKKPNEVWENPKHFICFNNVIHGELTTKTKSELATALAKLPF